MIETSMDSIKTLKLFMIVYMVMVNIYDEITMVNVYERKMCHDHWESSDARGLLASVHSSPEGSLR